MVTGFQSHVRPNAFDASISVGNDEFAPDRVPGPSQFVGVAWL